MKIFTFQNIDRRMDHVVARDVDEAFDIVLSNVTVWRRKNLTATEVTWPQEWLDRCESMGLTGMVRSKRGGQTVYVGNHKISS